MEILNDVNELSDQKLSSAGESDNVEDYWEKVLAEDRKNGCDCQNPYGEGIAHVSEICPVHN